MRLNVFLAGSTDLSRRAADKAISENRVTVNGQIAKLGISVTNADQVALDGKTVKPRTEYQTILLNKPVGYVCSRDGQGNKTIYELLPDNLQHLNPVGRLDKDSTGLLVMTDDGQLAQQLSHPSFQKTKIYQVALDKALTEHDAETIAKGVELEDGTSQLELQKLSDDKHWQVTMHEGRNRQIRRTFEALGYKVISLHRTEFGPYRLNDLISGNYKVIMV